MFNFLYMGLIVCLNIFPAFNCFIMRKSHVYFLHSANIVHNCKSGYKKNKTSKSNWAFSHSKYSNSEFPLVSLFFAIIYITWFSSSRKKLPRSFYSGGVCGVTFKISAENRLAMAACTPGTFAVKSLTSQPRYSAGNTENRCEKRRCLHARQHRLQPYLYVIFSSRCVHHCARTVLEATFNLARSSLCNGVSIVLEFLFASLPHLLWNGIGWCV